MILLLTSKTIAIIMLQQPFLLVIIVSGTGQDSCGDTCPSESIFC